MPPSGTRRVWSRTATFTGTSSTVAAVTLMLPRRAAIVLSARRSIGCPASLRATITVSTSRTPVRTVSAAWTLYVAESRRLVRLTDPGRMPVTTGGSGGALGSVDGAPDGSPPVGSPLGVGDPVGAALATGSVEGAVGAGPGGDRVGRGSGADVLAATSLVGTGRSRWAVSQAARIDPESRAATAMTRAGTNRPPGLAMARILGTSSGRATSGTCRIPRLRSIAMAGLDALLDDVRRQLPGVRLLTDPADRESYRLDETAYLSAGLPGAVAGIEGALTIAVTRMNRILEIDPDNLCVVTQPGVINAELKAAVVREGLFYPPDPASYETCSIGGNLGTNAGGLCCVKYGQTRDWVLGLEVVLADGSVIRTGGRLVKDTAGYSLTHLIVGSQDRKSTRLNSSHVEISY